MGAVPLKKNRHIRSYGSLPSRRSGGIFVLSNEDAQKRILDHNREVRPGQIRDVSMYDVIVTKNVPIKAWTNGVPVEDSARQQLINVASLPFIHKHVAVMPDVHWGRGATVGSVIASKGAIIPAAVGVDIGCGMMAARTSLNARQPPHELHAIRMTSEEASPASVETHKGGTRRADKAWV